MVVLALLGGGLQAPLMLGALVALHARLNATYAGASSGALVLPYVCAHSPFVAHSLEFAHAATPLHQKIPLILARIRAEDVDPECLARLTVLVTPSAAPWRAECLTNFASMEDYIQAAAASSHWGVGITSPWTEGEWATYHNATYYDGYVGASFGTPCLGEDVVTLRHDWRGGMLPLVRDDVDAQYAHGLRVGNAVADEYLAAPRPMQRSISFSRFPQDQG